MSNIHEYVSLLKLPKLELIMEIKQRYNDKKEFLINQVLDKYHLGNHTTESNFAKQIYKTNIQPMSIPSKSNQMKIRPTRRIKTESTTPTPSSILEDMPFFKVENIILKDINMMCCVNTSTQVKYFRLPRNCTDGYRVYMRIKQKGIDKHASIRLPNNIQITINKVTCELYSLKQSLETGIIIELKNGLIKDFKHRNCIEITWSYESLNFICDVVTATKQTHKELFNCLKSSLYSDEKTIDLIEKSIRGDIEIDENTVEISIKDILSKNRIELPVRGKYCTHIQCFDGRSYLQINEINETWLCPICRKKVLFKNIEVDNFFIKNVLEHPHLHKDTEIIILYGDGSWKNKKTLSLNKTFNNDICEFVISPAITESDNNYIGVIMKRPMYKAENIVKLQHCPTTVPTSYNHYISRK